MTSAVTPELGEWLSHMSLADVPAAVLHGAKRCVLDVLGVMIAGTTARVATVVLEGVRAEGGDCTIVGTTHRSTGAGAALANGVAAHALDFDDTSYAGIVHASAVVFPAALAAAEAARASGEALLEGFVAGVEIELALGEGLPRQVYFDGWWPTAVLGGVGAAAAAAKVAGLDARASAAAISIAAGAAAGSRACFGSVLKPYYAGRAAESGLAAARVAATLHDELPDMLAGEHGLLDLLRAGPPQRGAGDPYRLQTAGVAFKRYPVCSAAHAAVEAAASILASERIDEVRSVDCAVTPLVAASLTYPAPESVEEAQFSLPFAVGCVLAYGRLGLAELSDGVLRDAALRREMAKVRMSVDPGLEPGGPEAARVTVTTDGGSRYEHHVPCARGMPSRPLSDAELEGKFRGCVSPVLGAAAADELMRRAWGLDGLASARDLVGVGRPT